MAAKEEKAERVTEEPAFDPREHLAGLPIDGSSLGQAQRDMIERLNDGTITFDLDADDAALQQAVVEQETERKAPQEPTDEIEVEEAPDAEADEVEAEAAEESPEEEAVEEDEHDESIESYPMPELLTFDGEQAGIEVDGEFRTLEDLRDSYFRERDYYAKTQEAAEERKTAQERSAELAQTLAQEQATLGQMETIISSLVPEDRTQAEWAQLKAEDPQRYTQELEAHTQAKNHLDEIRAKQQEVTEAQQAEFERQREEALETLDTELRATIPGWSDVERIEEEAPKLSAWLQDEIGYKPEEIQAVFDPRAWRLAYHAWRGSQAADEARQVTETAKPKKRVLRAGRPKSAKEKVKRKDRTLVQSREALRQTGDQRHAERLFTELAERGVLR